jgi:amino-acid N-acetyltransferase
MLQPGLKVRAARAADRAAIVALLRACDLPTEDLDDAPVQLMVADGVDGLCGVIGLERFGDTALLRSLAVVPAHRRAGLGGDLVTLIEREARDAGVTELVLLTQKAEAFFASRGYRRIERGDAPPAVQASGEFRSLCPASAICMSKLLSPE